MLLSITEWDHSILQSMMQIQKDFWNAFFMTITHLGDKGLFWIILSIILMFPKKTRRTGICMAFALIGSVLVNNVILKHLIARERPFNTFDDIVCLIKDAKTTVTDFSFPSGHTGASFCAAVCIFIREKKRFGIPAMVLAALIAFSRIYICVHYPTDVFAGLIDGLLIGIIVCLIDKKVNFQEKFENLFGKIFGKKKKESK